MKKLSFLLILAILIACSSQVSREKAIEFKDNIHKIAESNHATFKPFVDEATKLVLNVFADPNCTIDFKLMNDLLAKATASNQNSFPMLNVIKEVDEKINYKSIYETYLKSELEVLIEFKSYFNTLEKTRDNTQITLAKDKVYNKLKIMKEKELILKEAESAFSQKYKL